MAEKHTIFKIIKKQNGEEFAQTIRKFHSGIFEIPDIEKIVKYAGHDATPILKYLVSLKNVDIPEEKTIKSPFELLYEAGYHAEYADTLEKQNNIYKYFAKNEELCTFGDENRHKNYYIINAVKFNADEIKRENFLTPNREDDYGTSVISIQILKTGGFISIKNRYNDTVENPDNTFNSNPDNIIKGLSASLKKYFYVDFSAKTEALPEGYITIREKILKYNYKKNNVYYGENFIAENGVIKDINTNYEIIMDYFIFDLHKKCFLQEYSGINLKTKDCFPKVFSRAVKGKKIQLTKNKTNKSKIITANNIPIIEINEGCITKLNLPKTKIIGNNFLADDNSLVSFSGKNLLIVKNNFLQSDNNFSDLHAPNLKIIGDNFLMFNKNILKLSLPKLVIAGKHFLAANEKLHELLTPNLMWAKRNFLFINKGIKDINLPRLMIAGNDFLYSDDKLSHFSAPNLKVKGKYFLYHSKIKTK